ncbi:MAG: alanine racemase [Bacteroidales bacterium]
MLEQKKHITVLEVNLDAILHNVNMVRSLLKPGVKLMGMVKAFAYGSGISEIGTMLEHNGVDYLGVANADEGVELREAGITQPVLVMIPEESSYDTIIRYNLEPELFSFRVLEGFIRKADSCGLSEWPVHIKLDTGMHRLGFQPHDAERLSEILKKTGSVRVVSVFTHLAATDSEADDERTKKQATLFESVFETIAGQLGYRPLRHILNSSGILRFPQFQFDMVRLGIGLYGLAAVDDLKMRHTSRFISKITQIKVVKAGEPVGYGYTDAAGHDRLIATIPAGYADGISRQMGNGRGSVWIDGRRVPIVGIICMDMFMADVSETNAAEGDLVEIFGDNISVRDVAEVCNTIPYEIITSIPPRVRRVFYHES